MNNLTTLVRSVLRSSSRLTLLLCASATVSIVFGLWGWFVVNTKLDLTTGDVIYRSIAALMLAFPYHTSELWLNDWRINVARWSGMLALIAGAGKTVFHLLENHWIHKQAERRQNQWMVIGDDPFARRLCDAAIEQGHNVHWLTCGQNRISKHRKANKKLFIDTQPWDISRAMDLGLNRAAGVVVADSSDTSTHAIAREIRHAVPDEQQLSVMASIQSPWLGMRVDEIDGAGGVQIFSEAQMAVRRLHRKHPPFLLAEKQAQNHIHLVIVDFSNYGEAILIETLLSSLTVTLQQPEFTIIDPKSNSIRNALQLRYPELSKSATLNFLDGQLAGDDKTIDNITLQQLASGSAVTAIYCCDTNDGTALSAALAMQTVISKQQGSNAPVFTLQFRSNTLPGVPIGVSRLKPGQLVSFGALDELATDTGLFSDRPEVLARTFHRAYRQLAQADKPADVAWEALSEDLRDANRRLVVHIPAKLHCMGLDLERWLIDVGVHFEAKQLPLFNLPRAHGQLIEQLAELEHERWMAERRINGWTYCEDRDDSRRLHPDLIPYAQLTHNSKRHDWQMVASLINMVSQ